VAVHDLRSLLCSPSRPGQRIIGSVSADGIIDLLICRERDYDEWSECERADDDEITLPKSFFYAEDILRRTIDFEAPRNGSKCEY